MIRFALIVASTLGFFLTAALGNFMVPLLRAFGPGQEPEAPQTSQLQPDSDPTTCRPRPPPTMGGLCLMVGTLAAVGVGWTAACVAEPALLGMRACGPPGSSSRCLGRWPLGPWAWPMTWPACAAMPRWASAARCGWGWRPRLLPPCRCCWRPTTALPPGWYCPALVTASLACWPPSCGAAPRRPCRERPGGRWSGRRGLRERVPRDAGPYGSHDHSGLVPAGGAACRIGRGADGAPALEFPPAKLLPGSVGSLFLAGALGCVPLSIGWPGLSVPLGLPYWLEGGMVALQILVYQASKGRKQLFGTAPLHRWLEKRGRAPISIFYTFCVFAMLGVALAMQMAKIS